MFYLYFYTSEGEKKSHLDLDYYFSVQWNIHHWILTTSVRVLIFNKAPSSADQAMSKGSGGGQQHEPV